MALSPVASLASITSSRHRRGGLEKQGPFVLQPCPARLVASTGQVDMSMRDQKRDLRSLFLSSIKFCQPLVAIQAASVSSARAAYSAGGSGGSSTVLEEGDAGLTSYVWSDPKRPRICVLGGGFGGLYTALLLESLIWPPDKKPQIVLVDQSDRFVFKPLLYELLSKEVESWEVAPSFKDLLANSSVQFCQDTVRSIQPYDAVNGTPALATSSRDVGGSVYLSSGMQVDYDWLVLALGSEPRMNIVPGAPEFAVPFNSFKDALEVERRLVALEKDASEFAPVEIVVVGSGYCGVELSATLAERLGKRGRIKVVDMTSDIVAAAPAGNREAASKILSSRDVELVLGYSVAYKSMLCSPSSRMEAPLSPLRCFRPNELVQLGGHARRRLGRNGLQVKCAYSPDYSTSPIDVVAEVKSQKNEMRNSVSVILLAGGKGTRMGANMPKQYLPLLGQPIAVHSFQTFASMVEVLEIVVVCEPSYRAVFEEAAKEVAVRVKFAIPGKERQDSVRSGLNEIEPSAKLACVHDSARPLVLVTDIRKVMKDAAIHGAAVLGVPVKATIKEAAVDGFVTKTLDRKYLWEMQTPQVIEPQLLRRGFELVERERLEVTDDVSIVEHLKHLVFITEGSYTNLKVTTPDDLRVAERILMLNNLQGAVAC